MSKKTVFHWSSGKDSALALFYLLNDIMFETDHLITSINDHYSRVTMHGTPFSLLQKQFQSLDMKYSIIRLPESPTMETYEQHMKEAMIAAKSEGYTHAAFGDIFLEDLKSYREKEMSDLGFQTVFPIWKKDTTTLIHEFVELGFKAVIVSANAELGEEFLGRTIDADFLNDLPKGIDPCGENGEFHTFCYDGPIFNNPIEFQLTKRIMRSYPNPAGDGSVDFWFQDLK